MLGLGAIFRLLVVALCLVPFAGAQRAAGALAPLLPAPAGESPGAPANEEEEDEREDSEGEQRHAPQARHCPPPETGAPLPPARDPHQSHLTKPRTSPARRTDWCRNGLAAPFRC